MHEKYGKREMKKAFEAKSSTVALGLAIRIAIHRARQASRLFHSPFTSSSSPSNEKRIEIRKYQNGKELAELKARLVDVAQSSRLGEPRVATRPESVSNSTRRIKPHKYKERHSTSRLFESRVFFGISIKNARSRDSSFSYEYSRASSQGGNAKRGESSSSRTPQKELAFILFPSSHRTANSFTV